LTFHFSLKLLRKNSKYYFRKIDSDSNIGNVIHSNIISPASFDLQKVRVRADGSVCLQSRCDHVIFKATDQSALRDLANGRLPDSEGLLGLWPGAKERSEKAMHPPQELVASGIPTTSEN
jgi:hypothetical protein